MILDHHKFHMFSCIQFYIDIIDKLFVVFISYLLKHVMSPMMSNNFLKPDVVPESLVKIRKVTVSNSENAMLEKENKQ